jgi:hypothetical protein
MLYILSQLIYSMIWILGILYTTSMSKQVLVKPNANPYSRRFIQNLLCLFMNFLWFAMDFGSLKEFLEYLNKYMFLEKRKLRNSVGPLFGLAQQPKRPHRPMPVARGWARTWEVTARGAHEVAQRPTTARVRRFSGGAGKSTGEARAFCWARWRGQE